MNPFKDQLLEHCKATLRRKMELISYTMDELTEAMDQETKSTVGNKHETARAKLQAEHESLGWQIDELRGQYRELERLDPERKYDSIAIGSLIETNHMTFYMTVPLGKVVFESRDIFVISQVSPIGQKLMGMKENEEFTFGNLHYKVLSIT